MNHRLPSRSACASCTPSAPLVLGGRAERPVAAVVGGLPAGRAGSIGKSYSLNTTRAASPVGRGAQLELHRAFAGSARAGEIGRELLLVEVDVRLGLVLRALIGAEHVDAASSGRGSRSSRPRRSGAAADSSRCGSRCSSCAPASSCGSRPACRRAAPPATRRPGNCRIQILHRGLSAKSCCLVAAELDVALGGLEGQRLRPDPVFPVRQRREVVVAGLIGVDRWW